MSKTFTSRPSMQGKGRGRGSGPPPPRPRNSTNLSPSRPVGPTGSRDSPSKSDNAQQTSQTGQYAGGYTKFTPNEKKRQQVMEMAKKETEAYEQHKRKNAGKTYSYVGTAGGGEMSVEEVRMRQANAVRAQKFNRQVRQAGYKSAQKQAEEREIELKKAAAREKANQNAARELAAPADDVRRKREAFLNQLEKNTAMSQRQKQQQHEQLQHQQSTERSTRHQQCANEESLSTVQYEHSAQNDRNQNINTSTATRLEYPNEECDIDLLSNMLPDLDQEYLAGLLHDTGSVEGVLELLGVGY